MTTAKQGDVRKITERTTKSKHENWENKNMSLCKEINPFLLI